jgi:membrane protein DedA with SNARE-associated domain
MGSIEQHLLQIISNIYNAIQWPGVILLMAIESACIPIPSELIMPLAGWMLIKAQGLSPLYCMMGGVLGALGNLIGSMVAYWVGAKGGRPFLEKYGRYILITRHDLDRADAWFNRRGTISVFISRILPVIRTFISLPAGIARMNFAKFLVYTIIGSFIWSTGLTYGGFLLGDHWEQIRTAMRPFDIPILIVVVILIAYYIYRHVRHFIKISPSQEKR